MHSVAFLRKECSDVVCRHELVMRLICILFRNNFIYYLKKEGAGLAETVQSEGRYVVWNHTAYRDNSVFIIIYMEKFFYVRKQP